MNEFTCGESVNIQGVGFCTIVGRDATHICVVPDGKHPGRHVWYKLEEMPLLTKIDRPVIGSEIQANEGRYILNYEGAQEMLRKYNENV